MRRPITVEEIARHLYPVRGEGGGPGAAALGIEAHGLVAADRQGPFYESEVPVEATMTVDGRQARISGRIDGIERTLLGDVIFEVKSYASPPEDADELSRRFPHHAFQLRVYGALRDAAELRLVAVPIGSDGRPATSRAREIVLPAEDISADLDLAIASLMDLRRRQSLRRRQRTRLPLEAPFEGWRPHQESVLAFLEHTPRSAIVAATGSGKTAPAMLFALGRTLATGRRLFWATSRTSGQPPVMETVRRMRERGAKGLRALRLTAQERLCPYPSGFCPNLLHHRKHVWELDVWPAACRKALVEESDLLELEQRHGVCARALQDEIQDLFDLLVGDYNFILDPRPFSRNLILAGVGVVIDEAHNVYERAREELSARVSSGNARKALEDRIDVAEVARAFLSELPTLPTEAPACDYAGLRPLALRSQALLAATTPGAPGRPFLEEMSSMAWALDDAENPRAGFGGSEGVHLACLDPAPFVASRLRSVDPLVLLSATLDPPELHLARIGLSDVVPRVIADPFSAQRKVLLVPAAGSLWEERAREAPRAAGAILRLVNAHRGRYLAFACSYDHVALIARELEGSDLHVVVQHKGMDRLAVERLAHGFCSGVEPSVLLAPAGGLLGEGVDLPPGLAGVFLLGPALPALTAERRAIQRYHDVAGDNGFAFAFLVPGLIRVVQAAGRVVRREGESAFIILLDRRFGNPRYRALLPQAWQAAPPLSLSQAVEVLSLGLAPSVEDGWEV